jgi:hypothetical protein
MRKATGLRTAARAGINVYSSGLGDKLVLDSALFLPDLAAIRRRFGVKLSESLILGLTFRQTEY